MVVAEDKINSTASSVTCITIAAPRQTGRQADRQTGRQAWQAQVGAKLPRVSVNICNQCARLGGGGREGESEKGGGREREGGTERGRERGKREGGWMIKGWGEI